jgi:hypothetical protein
VKFRLRTFPRWNYLRSASVPFALLLILVPAASRAQGTDTSPVSTGPAETRVNPITFATEFLERDYVNYYAFASGIWETLIPTLQNNIGGNTSGAGIEVGGGINLSHHFRHAQLNLNYRGGYRNYSVSNYGSGTDQSLALGYNVQVSRHWIVSTVLSAGIFYYGGTYFSPTVNNQAIVQANPFSPQTKFVNGSVGMTYQQSRRLSYSFSGGFFLNRYNWPGAIGFTGASGSFSANYRVTPRTTVGGSYSYSFFQYQQGAGDTNVHSLFLTLSRRFGQRWSASVSGGLSRSHSKGVIAVPVTIITGGVPVTGYVVGPYDQTTNTPYFAGSLSYAFRKSSVSFSAGQSVAPGNGFYLASRSRFLNGFYTRSLRRASFGLGGSYYNNSSISNSVSATYNTATLNVSYGYVVARYLSVNVRYDYLRYGGFGGAGGLSDNRFTYGIAFSSKSRPLTLY